MNCGEDAEMVPNAAMSRWAMTVHAHTVRHPRASLHICDQTIAIPSPPFTVAIGQHGRSQRQSHRQLPSPSPSPSPSQPPGTTPAAQLHSFARGPCYHRRMRPAAPCHSVIHLTPETPDHHRPSPSPSDISHATSPDDIVVIFRHDCDVLSI